MSEKTLLVADDSAVIRMKVRKVAEASGWNVVGEAADGRQAVELYGQHRPLAMTLDLTMPHCDGIWAVGEIMAINPEAKIIVISALAQKRLTAQLFASGITDFVVKPFDEPSLAKALEQVAAYEEAVAMLPAQGL